jgi:hypothetical protein
MASRWPYLLILALTPLAFLAVPLSQDEALGDFAGVRASAPWNVVSPRPFDVLQADAALQFYPWRDLLFESWRAGVPPFWNPYQLAGTPLLANSQSGALYPPHLLMAFAPGSTALRMNLLVWLHLALAGLGTYALARRLGANRAGAFFGGLCFGLSPFMTSWAALPSVVSTVAWIPWALWGAVGCWPCAAKGDLAPAPHLSARNVGRSAAALAFAVAMMLLAGHMQFAAFGLAALAVVACVMATLRRRPAGLAVVAGAVALGGALAAPQLVPVMDYARFSHRIAVPSEAGYRAYAAAAIRPFELPGLLIPQTYGDPSVFAAPGLAPLSGYWPALVKRGANFAESAIGLGPALLFAVLLLRRRAVAHPGVWAVGAAGLLALLLATGTPLARMIYFWVPGWASTGSPGRAGVLFLLAACVAGALALGAAQREDAPGKAVRRWLLPGGGVIAAWVWAAVWPAGESWIQGVEPAIVARIQHDAAMAALPLALIPLACAAICLATKRQQWLPHALAAGAVLGLLAFAWPPRHGAPLAAVAPPPDGGRIAVQNEAWELLVTVASALPPNAATASRIHDIGGYDSLLHRDTVRLLAEANGRDPAPPANGNMMFIKPGAPQAALARLGVSELWVRQDLATPDQRLAAEPGPGGLLRVPIAGPGRAFTARGPARIVSESLASLTVEADGPGLLTVRDRNMPGWTARIGDRRLEMAEGPWREVELPPGRHLVEFRYEPPGWRLGWTLFLCGLLVIAMAIVVQNLARRRLAPPSAK